MISMHDLKGMLARHPFLKKVAILSSGTAVGQAITLAVLPLLTRLYSTQDLGLLGVVMMAAGIFAVPAFLRLEFSIPIWRSDAAAAQVLLAGALASTVFLTLGLLASVANPQGVAAVLGQADLAPYVWMIPLCGWMISLYSALQLWALRQQRVNQVAKTHLTRAIGGSTVQVGFGLAGFGAIGLMLGFLVNNTLGSIGLLASLWRQEFRVIRAATIKRLNWALRKNTKYMAYSLPQSILNVIANSAPLIIIGALAGAAEAGLMLLALRVTSIPIGLLGSSMSRLYLADAKKHSETGDLHAFTNEIIRNLAKIGLPVFSGLAVLSIVAFPTIFGSEWERSGFMTAWLCPALFLQFITTPVSTAFVAKDRMDVALYVQVFAFVIILGSIGATYWLGYDFFFEAFAVSTFAYYMVYFMSLRWVVSR